MIRNLGLLVFVLFQVTDLLPAAPAHHLKAVDQRNDSGLPKPAVAPPTGTWKYTTRDDVPDNPNLLNDHSIFSVTIKDDGSSWTVSSAWEFPEGPVTDVLTLEKGTLALRKEAFRHFLHQEQPWKPVAVDVEIAGNKATGVMKYVGSKDKPFTVSVNAPLFAVSSVGLTVGCLPLADGYSTSFRYFDVERVALNPQAPDREKQLNLRVAGTERVTVPAGTFDSWKVELTSPNGSYRETVWIAKDSRTPVKISVTEIWKKGARTGTSSTTIEMVP